MSKGAGAGNLVSIGIMGGTFDPIHIGHLILAEEARQQLGLDEVLFVPAGEPPHKPGQVIARAEHRLQMVRLAVVDNEYFECSTVELDREGPSYTIDTVREIIGLLGGSARLFVLIGADEARNLMSWRDPYGIQALATIAVADRPGSDFETAVGALPEDFAQELVHLQMPGVNVSSTNIRERVLSGRSIKYLVPDAVERYILENGLYKTAATDHG
ncbi:MAG: nicotinate-nucleotide adenylyltransferase [Armatimonadetes bacterium]|nr:nicotinate-nucleotide adenylyltransferase [Armatimonadota bacterium]